MPLTEQEQEQIKAFRAYVEGDVATDDRYGEPQRNDREGKFTTRFEMASACWFDVTVDTGAPGICVVFLTSDATRIQEFKQELEETGDSAEKFVGSALRDAGVVRDDLKIEQTSADGLSGYSVTIPIDEIRDLDGQEPRNTTLRVLEGFTFAFAAALQVEDTGD